MRFFVVIPIYWNPSRSRERKYTKQKPEKKKTNENLRFIVWRTPRDPVAISERFLKEGKKKETCISSKCKQKNRRALIPEIWEPFFRCQCCSHAASLLSAAILDHARFSKTLRIKATHACVHVSFYSFFPRFSRVRYKSNKHTLKLFFVKVGSTLIGKQCGKSRKKNETLFVVFLYVVVQKAIGDKRGEKKMAPPSARIDSVLRGVRGFHKHPIGDTDRLRAVRHFYRAGKYANKKKTDDSSLLYFYRTPIAAIFDRYMSNRCGIGRVTHWTKSTQKSFLCFLFFGEKITEKLWECNL